MGLKNNLPQFIAEEKYTKEILDAIEPEIDNIKAEIEKMLLECCISTCSETGLKRYEEDYSIQYDASFSIKERKKRVINKMLNKKRLTFEELANFIKRNVDNTQFYISNFAEEYKLKILLIDESYKEKLYEALFRARPAHLMFEIIVVSYAKRCGVFNCGEYVL